MVLYRMYIETNYSLAKMPKHFLLESLGTDHLLYCILTEHETSKNYLKKRIHHTLDFCNILLYIYATIKLLS